MRTLYCPIHIPGTYNIRSRQNKHGLRDALSRQGACREIDYLSISPDDLETVLRTELDNFQPDSLFTQFQGVTDQYVSLLKGLRLSYPELKIVNWNGDVYPEHLIGSEMLALLENVDLQLVVNASVLKTYEDYGIRAAFCPFGYETPITPLPDAPHYDVLFLGNNYSEKRLALYQTLRSLNVDVGIYGSGWPQAEGECNYDFAQAESLYRNARVVVSDNQFLEARGYLSDRPIQALAAGTLLLQQYVADLEPLTGLANGVHYVEWGSFEELPNLVYHWLNPSQVKSRGRILRDGQTFVKSAHTWEARVRQLMIEWLPELGRVTA